ncbi:hypothetical protein AB205_0201350 [Aquarana catesbeiana]|uniref:Replication factor C C-terminal domain-containing protein n=1 Tax=Aquarana catesbeiana TaxID=8400 RepID=A0A2G9S6F9_AQUCT|nr:hypothetical protein AB205_0201350 [Aquarana catesbeiana]
MSGPSSIPSAVFWETYGSQKTAGTSEDTQREMRSREPGCEAARLHFLIPLTKMAAPPPERQIGYRGIDVVRNKIKMFAQQKVTLPKGRHKIIILDEADSCNPPGSRTPDFSIYLFLFMSFPEPIQSRCAVLRYTKLTDSQVLARLMIIVEKEKVQCTDDGLEAIVFTAQGDMRQALNNVQSTHAGFGYVNSTNVCDEPHPLLVKEMLQHCVNANIDEAYKIVAHLWKLGYSPEDIISIIFRVCKTFQMPEYLKLEFIKEIGYTHMKVTEGVNSLLQMAGLLARLCQKTAVSAS